MQKIVSALVIAASMVSLVACSASQPDEAGTVGERCVEIVASWSTTDVDEVSIDDVSDENFLSDEALDFRGSYPGGTWACGGARGDDDPRQVMVYPNGGYGERIYP